MRTKTLETWVLLGLALLVIGDGIALASTWRERMRALESGGYEVILGLILAGLAALYWFREPAANWDWGTKVKSVAVAFAILCAYVLAMPHLGYLLSTLLVLIVYLRGFGRYRWWTSLAFAAVFAVASTWFWAKLIIPLPSGFLPWPVV